MYLTRTPVPNLGSIASYCQCGALKFSSNDRCVACQPALSTNNARAKQNGELLRAVRSSATHLRHDSQIPSQPHTKTQDTLDDLLLWLKDNSQQPEKVRQLTENLHITCLDTVTDVSNHRETDTDRRRLITEVAEAEDDGSKPSAEDSSMDVLDFPEPQPIDTRQHQIQLLLREFEDDYTIVDQNLRLRGPENVRPDGCKRLEDLLRRLPTISQPRSETVSLNPDVKLDEGLEETCPYIPQNVITLNVEDRTASMGCRMVQATIVKVFEPFSLSCTMVIQPHESIHGHREQMVLKLYDRRFALGARKHYLEEEEIDWTPEMGRKFVQAVQDGTARSLAQKFYSRSGGVISTSNQLEEDEVPHWTDVHSEVQMWLGLTEWCLDEVEAYERLQDLQGNGIPRFISRVVKFTSPHVNSACHPSGMFLDVQGILIEYFPQSFNLRKIKKYAPQKHWKPIVDEATHLASLLYDRGVCNRDACPRNTLAYYDPHLDKFRTVLIDFGWSCFRISEKDIAWESMKARHDEEDNVGRATLMLFFRDAGWEYVQSETMRRLRLEYESGCNSYDEHFMEHINNDKCDEGCSDSGCNRFNAYWARYLARFYVRWEDHKSKGCGECQKPFDPCGNFRSEQELDNRRKWETKEKLLELLRDSSADDKGGECSVEE